MRKLCITFVAVAILLSWSGTANATSYGTLTASWRGVDPGTEVHKVTSPGINGNIYVGMYWLNNVTQNTPKIPPLPSKIPVYCIDTYEWAGGTSYEVKDLEDAPSASGVTGMGDIKADYLRDLIFEHYDVNATASDKAVFASCVWEIINESSTNLWDVAHGAMQVALSSAQTTTANSWLSTLSTEDHGTIAYALVSKSGNQDFAIVLESGGSIVPEPLTVLGMFGGLVGVGGYIRRRRLALA